MSLQGWKQVEVDAQDPGNLILASLLELKRYSQNVKERKQGHFFRM